MINGSTLSELSEWVEKNHKTVILTGASLVAPILFWSEPRTIIVKFIYRSYIWLVGDGQSLTTIALLGYAWADRKIITPSRKALKGVTYGFLVSMLVNYQIVGLDGGVIGRFIYDAVKYEPKLTGLVFIIGSLYNLTLITLIFKGITSKIPKLKIPKIPEKVIEVIDKIPALVTSPDETVRKIQEVLSAFGVRARVSKSLTANAFTRYNIDLESGVKFQSVQKLEPEIKYALGLDGVFVSMLGGRVFVDVEKKERDILYFRDVSKTEDFLNSHPLSIPIGVDVLGNVCYVNIQELPHLLVAGTTGSGKSVFLNVLICSLILKSDVQLILIDPKFVEFSMYSGIKLLRTPIINSVEEAVATLKQLTVVMNDRYQEMAKIGAKKIDDFNEKSEILKMKYIIVIIDELADLVSTAREEINAQISLLVGKARACGIFLIVATQKPSISDKVITGVIKGNLPSKVAFSVGTSSDSQMILDETGAEKLLGKGDMLFKAIGSNPKRLQCLFIEDSEIEEIVGEPERVFPPPVETVELPDIESIYKDELTADVISRAVEAGEVSVSKIQLWAKVGYNRASKIMIELEDFLEIEESKSGTARIVKGYKRR